MDSAHNPEMWTPFVILKCALRQQCDHTISFDLTAGSARIACIGRWYMLNMRFALSVGCLSRVQKRQSRPGIIFPAGFAAPAGTSKKARA